MPLTSTIKTGLNACLRPLNLQITTLTAAKAETRRLQKLRDRGQFQEPVFPVLPSFKEVQPDWILAAVDRAKAPMARFSRFSGCDESGYSFLNHYFTGVDAEVAYAMVGEVKPSRIIEIGSGNSTLLFRAAIRDARLATELVSIDPVPRRDVDAAADRVLKNRLEDVSSAEFETMIPNDILFIDSSHEVRIGNDVISLFLRILPRLPAGVIVHVHDIFLPYEYPEEWILANRWDWNEQYLVQALLQDSNAYEVLWPGQYLQRTLPAFSKHFPDEKGLASSLWLRKRG